MRKFRIGSRGSELALVQTRWVLSELGLDEARAELVVVSTKGDEVTDKALSQVGGSGIFIKAIESALLEERVDLAVHSMKDVPSRVPDGLQLAATTRREDPRDALVGRLDAKSPVASLDDLPDEARIATGSLRRRSQLLGVRPDLTIEDLRGNVPTRLAKLDASSWDAIVVAAAGVKRLGRAERIHSIISPDVLLPAVGQGALAIELRADDVEARSLVRRLNDDATERAVAAERALLARLQGGCQVPVGGYAVIEEGTLRLRAFVGSIDGTRHLRREREGPAVAAEEIGLALAESMLDEGAREIIEGVEKENLHHG